MSNLRIAPGICRFLHSSPHFNIQPSYINQKKNNEAVTSVETNLLENTLVEPKSAGITSQNKDLRDIELTLTLPEEPTTCCMSGCANCVWIEYADQVSKMFKSGEKAREVVLSKVSDPNMKAFLLMELKSIEN